MTILHLITGLAAGGAEHMLFRLVRDMDRTQFQPVVVSLTSGGAVAEKIAAAGVPVISLGMRRRIPDPRAILRFRRLLSEWDPAVVQTWLYHADLLGLAARRSRAALLWNIRCSNMDLREYPLLSRMAIAAAARASRIPDAVVVNSVAGREWHERLGYRPRRWVYIPNGIDTDRFRPDAQSCEAFRRELGVAPDVPLIGLVARFDPMKDHRTFLAAAAGIVRTRPDARFVLTGEGAETTAPSLARMIEEAGLEGRVHCLGYRPDVHRVIAALDVLALSSAYGEGFPNVIVEAMASGVPCVATDVGDARSILGEGAVLVAPRDAASLAAGVVKLLEQPGEMRARMSVALRERAVSRFSMPAVVRAYEELYATYGRGRG